MTAEARKEAVDQVLVSLDKEGVEVEFKAANDNLPKSIWETISAFANTAGGTLFLGVSETKRTFNVDGVQKAEKLESDFWNTFRNKNKISPFSIGTDAFEIIDAGNGKKIIRITIPQADYSEIPVYLNGDIRQTYIRRGEGDFLVNEEELKTLLRNNSQKSQDRVPLKSLSIDDLDRRALVSFKSLIEARYPGNYEEMKMQDFLLHVGLLDDSDKENICPYSGTLLLFGKYNVIKRYFDSYQMDYFDYRDSSERWSDRVATDDLGPDEMNIFNFYNIVYQKLASVSKAGFRMGKGMVRINTDMKEALREALINTIVHADYAIPNGSVRIEVYDTYYRFENPGKMLIPVEKFFRGGTTKSRNDVIMSVFRRLGLSERQGYGGYQIFRAASNNMLRTPIIETSIDKTVLTIWLVDLPGSYPDLDTVEKSILSCILHECILSKGELENMLPPDCSEYRIKKALRSLTDKGILSMTGSGRSVKYTINISATEKLGQIRLLLERLSEVFKK